MALTRRGFIGRLAAFGAAAALPFARSPRKASETIKGVFLAADHHHGHVTRNDAYLPEFWAEEALTILDKNMVAGEIIHRADYAGVEVRIAADRLKDETIVTRFPATFGPFYNLASGTSPLTPFFIKEC